MLKKVMHCDLLQIMSLALGTDCTNEHAENLHKVSRILRGECGLLLTNHDVEEVRIFFEKHRSVVFLFFLRFHMRSLIFLARCDAIALHWRASERKSVLLFCRLWKPMNWSVWFTLNVVNLKCSTFWHKSSNANLVVFVKVKICISLD